MVNSHLRHLQQTLGIQGDIVLSEQQDSLIGMMYEALSEHGNTTCVPFMLRLLCPVGLWMAEIEDVDTQKLVAQAEEMSKVADYMRALGWSSVRNRTDDAFAQILDVCRQCFPDEYFDLVDLTFIAGYTQRTSFPLLMQEMVRSCRKRGVVRWIESAFPVTNSQICDQFFLLLAQALDKAGLGFTLDERQQELSLSMKEWLHRAGCHKIRHMPLLLDVSKGTTAHFRFALEMSVLIQCIRPFLCDMGVITDEAYQRLSKQVCIELQASNFRGRCTVHIVWGRVMV